MAKRRGTIDASVEKYAAEKRRTEDAHPEVEELAAYHGGDLDEEAQERIREHLTFCEECSNLVLDLAGFSSLEPPSEDHRLSAEEVEARKERLMARIRGGEKPSARLLEFAPRPEEVRIELKHSVPVWYHGVAAALLAATVGVSFWALSLRQQVAVGTAGPSAARLNPVVQNLNPVGDNLRSSVRSETVVVSPDQDLVLLLTFLEDVSYEDYRIEIYGGAHGEMLRSEDGLKRQVDGLFTLTFPSRLHTGAGKFRLRVLGLGEGEPEPLAEYDLWIEDGTDPRGP